MTEPQGGADPRVFTTRAVRDGDGWVIDGRKYWSSNASVASFLIVVAVTDPDVPVHKGASTFLIPRDTPGVVIEAGHHLFGAHRHEPGHSLVRYENVRVPAEAMLGEEGHGFEVAQSRLAGGRLHHAMRAIGVAQRAIDMMAERAKSRFTQGSALADKQFVQGFIAESYTELMPFRLAVLHAAWLIDTQGEHAARTDIAALKVLTPKVLQSIVTRAIQVHGGLGTTEQLPLVDMLMQGLALGLADGPTEAHKVNLARRLLKGYEAGDPEWPSEFLGRRIEAARAKYGDLVGAVPSVPSGPPSLTN
jgi:alkylation response protein AidB-like acyl-CoA dehydrogenase